MAQVTTWLKRLSKAPRWHRVMCKPVMPIRAGRFELWFTDADNRVLRCKLEPPELRALYEQLQKFFGRVG
jgi:hypothetical protein